MKKLPRLYEYSERVYADYMRTQKKGGAEEAWAAAYCYVLTPVLFLYVLWVLADALWNGKRRLYFLARDGYMMYTAAKYICEQWQLPLECRYLHCSRYSLRSGEYRLLGEKGLDYVCLGGMRVTLERMLLRGGLTEQEAAQAGKAMGWEHRMHELLTYEQVKSLRPFLKDNAFFMERMRRHAKEAYPSVIGYLGQEGLMDKVPYALVDSGWTGSIQRSVGRLLKSAGYGGTVEGYYFGIYEYVKGVNPARYHTWYFAPRGKNWRKAFFCNNLFECVFSSPEGMVRGYRLEGEKYRPVFAAEGNPNRRRMERGADILLQYAGYYTGEYREDRAGRDLQMEMRVAAKLLHSFMACPSVEEAKAYGGYLFDDDVSGEEKQPLAHALPYHEIKEGRVVRKVSRYLMGKGRPALQSAWPEAGIRLSSAAGGFDLFQTALYKFLLYSRKDWEQRRKGMK